jgi:DNA-directed RNA polymerase specialized sigma24 family protein
MEPSETFQDLLRRVRAGEEAAAAELVRLFEPEVRRAVRMSLTDPRLRRTLDSVDICQSVLAIFFVKVMGGSFDLDEPSQLVRLLVRMARNKLVDRTRKPSHLKEIAADPGLLEGFVGPEKSPSHIIAHEELLRALHEQLTNEERQIAEQRAAGREWAAIAADPGGTADSVRKKMNRAIARVCSRLGLDGVERA